MLTIQKLLTKYRENKVNQSSFAAHRLIFKGIEEQDVYNISAPFIFNDKEFILGRVEPRDSEYSKAYFFEKIKETEYIIAEKYPSFDLQDPFFTFIKGKLILGGVEVKAKQKNPDELEWRTIFYEINSDLQVMEILVGPVGMKDLRLKELADGRILVLTRPQGEKGGRGKIGAIIADKLSAITTEVILEAPLLERQFTNDEWGGANEIYLLEDNIVGVLGHIANFDQMGNRHYYALTFELDLTSFEMSHPKIIAERTDFLSGPSKRPDLTDVVFSGGLVFGENNRIYAGVSDADAQFLEINNPFAKKEKR